MGMGKTANGNKISRGMGMGWELSAWELEWELEKMLHTVTSKHLQ